jgi:uncharacterized protein VirK/YbjX
VTRILEKNQIVGILDSDCSPSINAMPHSLPARLTESLALTEDTGSIFWVSIWKLARQRYYWSSDRFSRIVWTLARNIPTQLKVLRVLSRPAYKQLMASNSRFPLKWMGLDYLARGLTLAQQAECFMHHYRRLPDVLTEDALVKTLLDEILLDEIREGSNLFAIKMALSRPWDDEGELSLNFEVNGRAVFVLSFTIIPGTIVQSKSDEVMLISRVQGVRGCYDEIQFATKTLHDIAPPALLFAALCGVADAYGVNAMAGINATMKPEFHFYQGEAGNIQEAYDDFFTELGATKGPANFFLSDLPPREKPITLIKRGHKTRTRTKRAFKREIAQRICRLLR